MRVSHCGAMARARSMMFMLGILGTNRLPPAHIFKANEYKLCRLLQRNPKAGHVRIGNRQIAVVLEFHKIGDNTAAAAHHIAVPDNAEYRFPYGCRSCCRR